MTRWERGRAEVDDLLARGRLTRVETNRDLAASYVGQARAHLNAAGLVTEIDAAGAFALVYDAARLGLAAVLVVQGLRPRGEGAHDAVLLEVVLAQTEPPRQEAFRQFD